MKNKHQERQNRRLRTLLKDSGISLAILISTTMLCLFLDTIGEASSFSSLFYVLSVLVISRVTSGYMFGIISSFLAVFGVNYMFTAPYFAFNFTIEGYPLTFMCFLIVSLMTSTLTTRIKQAEKMRVEAEKERLRANLLRAVSHYLRTPLTSIIGATTAVLENEDKLEATELRDLLCNVIDDANWLIRMVENLLLITKVGTQSSDRETQLNTNLETPEEIIAEAVRKFRKQHNDIDVRIFLPEETVFVNIDAMLICQVLMNLLENAVEHGGNITTIEIIVSKEDAFVRISIIDDGQGISQSRLPHLFDGSLLLTQSSTGSADNHRNMGIGLSVCKSIINAHGGKIAARNGSEKGAEFYFILPIAKISDS